MVAVVVCGCRGSALHVRGACCWHHRTFLLTRFPLPTPPLQVTHRETIRDMGELGAAVVVKGGVRALLWLVGPVGVLAFFFRRVLGGWGQSVGNCLAC